MVCSSVRRLEHVAPAFIEDPVAPQLLEGPALSGHKVIEQPLHRTLEVKLSIALPLQHAVLFESAY